MIDVRLELTRVRNGCVVEIWQPPKDEGGHAQVVYQARHCGDDDEEANSVEAFADLLRFLLEEYGPQTRKDSPKRIRILVEPGEDWAMMQKQLAAARRKRKPGLVSRRNRAETTAF
jgi:hypothetical protein